VDVDGAACIVPRSVAVELGGREFRIPAAPAAPWMLTLLEGGWADIVPGMLVGDGLDALHDDIADGVVTTEQCEQAARDVVSTVAGCPWWSAAKLLHSAAADPAAMGELRMSGADPEVVPLGAALVALYRIYTRDKEKKDIAKLDAELDKLPPGVSAAERYDPAVAADAFERMMAARGG
jgi:hypothetical protein